ncbi:hypothetical protein GGX14DRAFT_479796, partial [Mycena pura]
MSRCCQRFETRPGFVQDEPDMALFYEGILNLKLHPESADMVCVQARLAVSYSQLGATGSAIEPAEEDSEFDSLAEAVNAAASNMLATSYATDPPTKLGKQPRTIFSLPGYPPPQGHGVLRSRWQSMSMKDLIRHGVARGVVEAHHQSEIKEHGVILNDTLAVYELVELVVKGDYDLTPDKISEIHSRLMATARFYVYVDTTRGRVTFCPYTAVNSELVAICRSFIILE